MIPKKNAPQDRLGIRDLLCFMPELLGAVVVVIGAPFYCVDLVHRGLMLPAFYLAIGWGVVAVLAYRGFCRRSKVLIYLAILVALGIGLSIHYWVGKI